MFDEVLKDISKIHLPAKIVLQHPFLQLNEIRKKYTLHIAHAHINVTLYVIRSTSIIITS